MNKCDDILKQLNALANPENVSGMARYGINPHNTLGISIYTLRKMAREIGHHHILANELWESGIHEARILASYVDLPEWVTEDQIENWVMDFDSWDVVDQVCDLFDKTRFAYAKAHSWSDRKEEFVKRAGFVLMAGLAVHDKMASDDAFTQFFPDIIAKSEDSRNFVKKAINWALRNIGKRNWYLNLQAIEVAKQLSASPLSSAHWIGRDALRELTSEKIQCRFKR